MNSIEDTYTLRVQKFSDDLNQIRKQLALISLFRLITFLLIFFSLFYVVRINTILGIIASFLFTFLFFMQIKRYNFLQRKRTIISNLKKINQEEIETLANQYAQFPNGAEFSDPEHPYTHDLDIFGEGSLFQYLNRTTTHRGKEKLAYLLANPFTETQSIKNNQEAIKDLLPKLDLRQNFRATGMLNGENAGDFSDIESWLQKEFRYYRKKVYHILIYLFPIISIGALAAVIVDYSFIQNLVLIFLVQLFVTSMHLRYNNRVNFDLGKRLETFRKYDRLLRYIEEEDFSSVQLTKMKNSLKSGNDSARVRINKLAKLIASFDNRLNLIVGVLLNGFLLWDIQCMIRLEKWKSENRNKVREWIETLGDFDVLCSLANYGYNNPGFDFPEPDATIIIDFKEAGHPLIHRDERVNNDIILSNTGEFIIVTGANMAGKSTFLRTVAINLLLSMIGAPICAKHARFRPLQIFSSMRTSDSLQKNESYFFAELKRLKELIDRLRAGETLFVVLDEILKGTNSTDKQKGSRAILRQIVKLNGTGLIATHDLDLAAMEKELPQHLKNKCFEIEINGAEIFFDYKLYEGVTQKMNASLLMKQMGILIEN